MASAPAVSWSQLGLVVAGGAIGTALRAGILLIEDPAWAWLTVPVINVVGAFGLGVVVGLAARRGDSPRTRAFRQFFGAGLFGGFTTYSAFAVQSADIAAAGVAFATVVVGTAAAWAGLLLTRGRMPRPAEAP
ncbi:MAG: CrcB family protein [Microbacterium sp.]